MTDAAHIRVLRRADAAIFHAHRLGALLECPEAFGSTFTEDSTLSLDVVADRLELRTELPRRVVFGAFEGDTLVGFVGCVRPLRVR